MLALFTLVGHCFLWVTAVNLIHSLHMPHRRCTALTLAFFAAFGLGPVAFLAGFLAVGWNPLESSRWLHLPWWGQWYVALCWPIGALGLADWLWRRALRPRPKGLRCQRAQVTTVLPADHPSLSGRRLGREALTIELAEKELELPCLPEVLDGLSILHVSDIHFTGKVPREYFEEVVRLGNAWEPDLVAVTGDIIDGSAFINWVPQTLGRLRGRFGAYFVLGNHDQRHDWRRLRRTLTDCGYVDLGGRWLQTDIRGEPILLAGNELPWFSPAADLADAPPPSCEGGPPRILLAHGPDQFGWARQRSFDLMLAGHNHGGQIQLPFYGPVFSPSWTGVAYASGTFGSGSTLLHVSRGVSSKLPFRWNCPPEMIRLVLRCPAVKADARCADPNGEFGRDLAPPPFPERGPAGTFRDSEPTSRLPHRTA
jgi:predicted MPP superfamily phosphohydrolase